MTEPLKHLYVYLTDHCNLRCSHCWQSAPVAGQQFKYLKFRDAETFLGDAVSMGLQSAVLSGGEPLLSPDFVDFVSFLHANKVACSLETNGMLISGPRLEAIERCNVGCAISLDGRSAETHNRQRGRETAFACTIRGMERLEERNINYQIIMAISRANYPEMVPLLDWVRDDWPHCKIVKLNVVLPEGRGEDMHGEGLLFGPRDIMDLAQEVSGLARRYPFSVLLHAEPVFFSLDDRLSGCCCGGNCGYQHALSLLANGGISICSLGKIIPEYIFGYLPDADARTIWEQNSTLNLIHNEGYQHLKGVCSMCIFRRACIGSCRALALRTAGDFFAAAPSCQRLYDAGLFPKGLLRSPDRYPTAASFVPEAVLRTVSK